MKPSSVLFIGIGGAGQRHLRILRTHLPMARFMFFDIQSNIPIIKSNFTVSYDKPMEEVYSIERMANLDAGLAERPDMVVISTPTSLHLKPLMAAAKAGISILVEKPWSNTLLGFKEFQHAVEVGEFAFRIGFMRRYHPLMIRLSNLVNNGTLGRIISATFITASNVPNWHPYEDWQSMYAVKPDLGGGVLLTEIHEIDLSYWFFGLPKRVFCNGGNFGFHKLDVEDTAHLTLDYEKFSVTISLCFMQQKTRRVIEIAGTLGSVVWDATGNRLIYTNYANNNTEEIAAPAFSFESMFEHQDVAFLADLSPALNNDHLRRAWASQAIVAAAKESMLNGQFVSLPLMFSEYIS